MRVQSINLNLIPTGVMPIVHLSQYDRDADGALLFNIFNGPAPFNLTGCTATINGTKPDGNVYTYPCTVHSNFLTSAVYDQMTTVQGTHEAEIRISDGDSVVGTLNFQMAIEKAGVSEIDVSHTDVPTLLENIQASVDEAEYWAEQAAGAVAGVASFNGRHGSVLPIAGDYDSEKILLTSALHIGGETQNNVQEALEAIINDGGAGHTILNGLGQEMPQRKNLRFAGANVSDDAENDTTNVTISGGGSTITVTTTETSLYGETVTISDGTTTDTEQFSAGGVATFTGITMTGMLTITSTDGTETATDTLNVPYYGNYTKAIAFFTFNATLNISTSASSLYGQTITITKGGVTVGTTAFSAQGSASYTVHETGTYTCECEGYSGSATVSAETTYNVTINAGLDLSSWITAGSTTDYPLNPSSYADFSALEADEAAVRQLMTVHASVDYLARATAGDSLMQSVIGSDVCAKWINLSDYALDTLSANSDIKSVMDTADKYGYGEWGIVDATTTPPTWGALGNVPIMTANDAPYGVASAYQVFDGNASTSASGTDFSYQSVNPICVKGYKAIGAGGATITGTIQGSNDGSTWTNITLASNTTYYMYHRLHLASSTAVYTLQFYGRELTGLVPTMTGNTPPRGTLSASNVNISQPAWKAFDGDNATYFYDQTHDAYVEYTFAEDVRAKAILTIWERNSSSTGSATMEVDMYTNGAYSKVAEYTTTAPGGSTNPITEPLATVNAVISKVKAKDIGSNGYILVHTLQVFGFDYSEKEFAQGSTRKTIYDHGVAPSGAITGGTKNPDCLTLSAVGTATITIDKGTRTYMGGKAGLHASGTNRLICGSGYSAFTASNMPDSNGFDISSISGSVAVGIEQTASGTFDCTEIWIE